MVSVVAWVDSEGSSFAIREEYGNAFCAIDCLYIRQLVVNISLIKNLIMGCQVRTELF